MSFDRKRYVAAAVVALLLLGGSAPARADNTPIAESLFQQGVAAMNAGDYARACALLHDSQRLDPGGGTLLNLALCHERKGELATAWGRYHEALGAARRDGREDRIAFATEHIQSLEHRLARLGVSMTSRLEGAQARLDGVELPASAWDGLVPVDPGEHVLRVEAPGRAPWSTPITAAEGRTLRVTVPELALSPQARSTAPAAPASRGRTQRALGWSVTGVGASAVVASAVLGALAIGAESTADAACPGAGACADPRGLDASERANTFATAATISVAAGAALLVGGIVLLVTGPSPGAADR